MSGLKTAIKSLVARSPFRQSGLPPDLDEDFLPLADQIRGFTMTSVERQFALWSAVRYLEEARVEGSFVECGVWRGGSTMLMALTLLQLGSSDRRLFLFDTFSGMSEPTAADVAPDGTRVEDLWEEIRNDSESEILAAASLSEVRANVASTGYPGTQVEYVRGMVEETIPASAPQRIALLRLDTDWYESTKHELEHLWPRLSEGGVLIVDDYGHWEGARRAVDEFFARNERAVLLTRLDETGRLAIKATGAATQGETSPP